MQNEMLSQTTEFHWLAPYQWNHNDLSGMQNYLNNSSLLFLSHHRHDANVLLLVFQTHTKKMPSFCNLNTQLAPILLPQKWQDIFHTIIKHNNFTKSEFTIMKKQW